MSFKSKLTKEYNQKVKKTEGYQKIKQEIKPVKTNHYLFQTLKISFATVGCLVGAFALVAGLAFMSAIFHEETHTTSIKKVRFSIYDTELVKSSTFSALNNITYTEEKENNAIDSKFANNLNAFANNSFAKFDKSSNIAYSPLMLYTHLDLISLAASDDETKQQFDQVLLTSDASLRETNIYNAMKNNFFVNEKAQSTVQAKNAVFIERLFGADETFVNNLTKRNAEAYLLNFQNDKDVDNIVEWISQSVNQKNFISKDELQIQDDTALLFVSSLFFDNAWSSKFKTQDTREDTFYLTNDEEIQTKFMNHTYYGEYVDCGEYVSVTDYYNSSYSIQYFVPKDIKDNIFDVLPANFLDSEGKKEEVMISLSLPKFQITTQNDLSGIVQDLGITNPYVKYSNHLKNAFLNKDDLEYSYLYYTKQKTSVAFDEDGTVVKSIVMSAAAGAAKAPMNKGYDVKLNQPFVYCIKDSNNLPLILGSIINPTKQ